MIDAVSSCSVSMLTSWASSTVPISAARVAQTRSWRRISAPAIEPADWRKRNGSSIRQQMALSTTRFFLSRVKNSDGGGS